MTADPRPPGALDRPPAGVEVIRPANGHAAALVRSAGPLPAGPWTADRAPLEEMVLGYLSRAEVAR